MKHIVSYSGGVGSFVAASRVVERCGRENTLLIFTDTLIEDPDLYRFLEEGAKALGAELVWLKDGRNPWEVFRDERYIGNSRTAPCSSILKRETMSKYLKEHYGPEECIIYLGIDWTEEHRIHRARESNKPYQVEAPLCESPYLSKQDMFRIVKGYGIAVPSLYRKGFSHNNCGGFCVRAGQGQFARLLEQKPDLYKWHEEQMEEVLIDIPTARPFITKTIKGTRHYLSLKDFREMVQSEAEEVDQYDIGGCGCFVDD